MPAPSCTRLFSTSTVSLATTSRLKFLTSRYIYIYVWLLVKNPGKWKHGPKLVVPWWFNFDPYPYMYEDSREFYRAKV